jgi:hypothetical protein
VSYATAAQQATLTTSAPLSPGPVCVATVSTAAQDSTAVPLDSAFS